MVNEARRVDITAEEKKKWKIRIMPMVYAQIFEQDFCV